MLSLIALTACQSDARNWAAPISAMSLSDEYERSGNDTRSKYGGREITVRGFARTAPTMPEPGGDQGSVVLAERDRVLTHPCVCWFSKDQAPALSKVKGGQYVTVRGVFSGEIGANLKFCSLIEIENESG